MDSAQSTFLRKVREEAKARNETSRTSLTNVFKVKVKFKAMHI